MTEPTRGDDEERRRIQQALVEDLARTQVVQSPGSRQLLVQRLRERLDHPMLADRPDPWRQSQEIVYFCTRGAPDAVRVMAAEVRGLDGDSAQVRALCRLRDEWEACDSFQPEDWQLRPGLMALQLPHLTRLYQRAAGRSAPPPWCVDAWHIFVYLEGGNTGGGVPAGMDFLALLEPDLEPDLAGLVRRRNQRRASTLGVTEDLGHRRYLIDRRIDQPASATVFLAIQLAPDLAPDDDPDAVGRYWLSLFYQWRNADSWQSEQHGEDRTVRREDLPQEVERAVRAMESRLADVLGTVVVEFVLPRELLNLGVEWWPIDSSAVLAMEYPVVIRSLERLQNRWWHRSWRRRWQRLQAAPAASQIYWSEPTGDNHLQRLETELRADDRWAALVPSEPPAMTGKGDRVGQLEVAAALRAGLPVIIWHRGDCGDGVFRETVDRLTSGGGLAQLPMRVKRLRQEAMLDPEQRPDHVGRHLTVLWDDPERQPEVAGGAGNVRVEGA